MMVDDAHSSGVLGRNGRGTIDHFKMHGRVDIQVGTLSKAIGALGGYVCGSRDLIDFLYHRARPFLFSTSHPPSVAATCIAAFDVLEQEPERIEKLWENTRYWKKELGVLGFNIGGENHAGQRDADHPDHHRRRQADNGILARAVQGRRAGHGHRVPHRARRQGAHPHHHDGDSHRRGTAAGAGSPEAGGKENGNCKLEVRSDLSSRASARELRGLIGQRPVVATQCCLLQSARYTIRPPTMVATTLPVSCAPSNGVLCDRECDLAASNVQRFFGSKMVTSAWLPRISVPRPLRLNTRAGPAVKSSTIRLSGIFFSRCRW